MERGKILSHFSLIGGLLPNPANMWLQIGFRLDFERNLDAWHLHAACYGILVGLGWLGDWDIWLPIRHSLSPFQTTIEQSKLGIILMWKQSWPTASSAFRCQWICNLEVDNKGSIPTDGSQDTPTSAFLICIPTRLGIWLRPPLLQIWSLLM